MTEGPKTRPVLESIPPEYLTLVGRVAFSWSLFENALRKTIFMMLDLSDSRGRTAVRTPRAKEMVEMIHELAITEKFTIDLSALDATDEVERRRNLVVHGIWYADDEGGLLLQDLTGRWPKTPKRPAIKRRVLAAAVPIRLENLEDLAQAIESLTHSVYAARRAIHERRSSLRQTLPAQALQEGSQGRDQSAEPVHQPPPSQE